MSVVALMMAFAGVVVDGVGNTQMDSIQTCASTSSYYAVDNYVYYGNSAYNNDAMTCIQHYYTSDTDCYCVDSESNCFFSEWTKRLWFDNYELYHQPEGVHCDGCVVFGVSLGIFDRDLFFNLLSVWIPQEEEHQFQE